jgi:hypothetical protein
MILHVRSESKSETFNIICIIIDHENDSYNYSSITIHNVTPEILYIQFPIGELP